MPEQGLQGLEHHQGDSPLENPIGQGQALSLQFGLTALVRLFNTTSGVNPKFSLPLYKRGNLFCFNPFLSV